VTPITSITGTNGDVEGERELVSLWEALADVLRKETVLYRELYELCEHERDVLVNFSTPELLENNSRKETIILKARLLDESRAKLVARIAEALGIEADGIDLTTLAGYAGRRHGAVLRELQAVLREILVRLDERNERNKVLVSSSIQHVQKSIEFISRLVTPPSCYGTDGEMRSTDATGRIVCRKE